MGNGRRKRGDSGNLRCSCQACLRGSKLLLSLLSVIDINRQTIPLDDASLPITQRLTTSVVPAILTVCPTQTVYGLVGCSIPNRMIEGIRSLCEIIRMQEILPTMMEEILESHAAIV